MAGWIILGCTLYVLGGLLCGIAYIGHTRDMAERWYDHVTRVIMFLWVVLLGVPLQVLRLLWDLIKHMLLWSYKVGKGQS